MTKKKEEYYKKKVLEAVGQMPPEVIFEIGEREFGPQCEDRAAHGYNSGMGEIFRRAASVSPIVIKSPRAALPSGSTPTREMEVPEVDWEPQPRDATGGAAPPDAESAPNESCTSAA